jgi:hypothetical protein
MAADATATLEDVNGNGDYHRLYVKKTLADDSGWPFRTGQDVRLQLVETTCGRQAVVVTSAALEVDEDITDLGMERTTKEIQQTLEDLEDVEGRAES